jgi:hypothetical protein
VLEQAAPGQNVMSVAEAWQIYLRQRAALWLEGVLALRTFLLDEIKTDECKSAYRVDPSAYICKKIMSVPARGESVGATPRTMGLAQAITKKVRCTDLLWRTSSYAVADLLQGPQKPYLYVDFCWPGLNIQQLIDDSFLVKTLKPEWTVGGLASVPVNDCIKFLSTAAIIGRLPTMASGCVSLTNAELDILANRCTDVHDLSASDDTIDAHQPPPEVEPLLPKSLTVLLHKCPHGVNGWQLSRAEILLRLLDSRRTKDYVKGTTNAINTRAAYMHHVVR